jgi:hypothetical protein
MNRTFKVHSWGEEPTAAFALWIDLTRKQVAAVESVANSRGDGRVLELLRGIAIDAIEAKIPNLGPIYRRNAPHHVT